MSAVGDWVAAAGSDDDEMHHHHGSLPTIVSPSDLFDGELFGDELIDIYNSTVDGHDDNDEIGKLLSSKRGEDAEEMLASMDDGFGTFRPSTSFNDFSSLLAPPPVEPTAVEAAAVQQPVVAAPVTSTSTIPTSVDVHVAPPKKRAASSSGTTAGGPPPPSPKRNKPNGRRVTAATTKKDAPATLASTTAPFAITQIVLPAATTTTNSAATAVATTATSKTVAAAAAAIKTKSGDKKSTPNPLTTTTGTATITAAAAARSLPANVVAFSKAPQVVRTKIVDQVPKHITAIMMTTTAIAPVPAEIPSACGIEQKHEDPAEFNKMVANSSASTWIHSASGGTDAHVPTAAALAAANDGEKVDTSTAHIKALTGNNWVAACAGTTQGIGISSVSSDLDDSKSGCNRNRRQNLTPDERARQNRDRNREHARNTRLRKKAYVEELKRTLTELVAQRDASDFEKRQTAQRELEQREVRFRVIEEFLKLRGRNETNFARWAAILEEGFVLTLPSMDFCKMAQGSFGATPDFEQVLNGVSDVMADANAFSEFLHSLGSKEGTVTCMFQCDRKNFFMDGCQAVLEWTATTVGAVAKGAYSELTLKGVVRGKFSPASNKLLTAHVTCDTGAVLLQMQKLSGVVMSLVDSSCFDAAQVAACQADAILDSLQMPCIPTSVPTAVIVNPSSDESCGKGDGDSDDSIGEPSEKPFKLEKAAPLMKTEPVISFS